MTETEALSPIEETQAPLSEEEPAILLPTLTDEDLEVRAQMAVGDKVVRSPLVCVLGHTNHGKTTLLDYIRGTVVAKQEAGLLTQHIGASFIPVEAIRKFCGPKYANIDLKIPGLLVLDTPGHAAFMNLRKRGGGVADIAILVLDVSSGSRPITWESVHILRERRTPFIIAANKIDQHHGVGIYQGCRLPRFL